MPPPDRAMPILFDTKITALTTLHHLILLP